MKLLNRLLWIALAASAAAAYADGEAERAPRWRDPSAPAAAPTPAPKPKAPAISEVRPELTVKKAPAKEINLPGVMKLAGEDVAALDFSRARRIQMNNGGAVATYISSTEPNRIQLPFVNPRVVSLNCIDVDRRPESNNVYIAVKPDCAKDKPIPVFIEHPTGRGPVLTLQLIPKGIISQTLIVDDVAPEISESQLKAQRSSEFITQTQALLETVAQGSAPQGYSLVELQTPPIIFNGLIVEVEKKLSSRENDIFIYQVSNPGQGTAVLKEAEFDGDLVQAVSIHPTPTLKPGQKTRVMVLARKDRKEQ